MTRNDGPSGSRGSDWDDWNSPASDPPTSEFGPVGSWDTMAGGHGAWGQPAGGPAPGGRYEWGYPTEPRPERKRWPIVVGASAAVVAMIAAGIAAFVVTGRGTGADAVQAAATTAPGTSAWTTSSVAPTTSEEPTVVPAAPARSTGSACTAPDVARDIGRRVDEVDCYGDWAVAYTNAHGNAVRKVSGKWTITGYSGSSCTGDRGRAEIPAAMFEEHFVYCPTTRSSSSRATGSRSPASRPGSSPSRSSVPAPPPVEVPPAPEPPPAPPVDEEPLPSEDPAPPEEDPTEASEPSDTAEDTTG